MSEAERTIETPDDPPPAGDAGDTDGVDGARDDRSEVTDDGTPEGVSGATPVRGPRRVAVLVAVAAFAYLVDLATKIWVVTSLENQRSIDVIGDWMRFRAVRNAGAAFGIGSALTVVFTCIAAAVIVVIFRLARRLYSVPWAIALGLLLGGALGNLTDRLFRSPGAFQGHVVDFVAVQHFAVFNLADSAIVCGGILIVLLSFRGLDPDGTVHRD
ncbi:signal peptidase II [Streptomyces avicenniae]|uniref:signal peptidase II n=1 Tax=Streptomyces avicenniae TaxID=500153 RepID=UPI00069C985B|nr:signal peptidase II [Streptomyces avicenniae]